jgi:hypothetical protein
VHAVRVAHAVNEETGKSPVHRCARITASSWVGRISCGPRCGLTYEAGPTGFGLVRAIIGAGMECLVAAASKLQRPARGRVKSAAGDVAPLARPPRQGEVWHCRGHAVRIGQHANCASLREVRPTRQASRQRCNRLGANAIKARTEQQRLTRSGCLAGKFQFSGTHRAVTARDRIHRTSTRVAVLDMFHLGGVAISMRAVVRLFGCRHG